METVSYAEQSSAIAKMCPIDQWGNDIFMSWDKMTYERLLHVHTKAVRGYHKLHILHNALMIM